MTVTRSLAPKGAQVELHPIFMFRFLRPCMIAARIIELD
jgi:hypothetical protein